MRKSKMSLLILIAVFMLFTYCSLTVFAVEKFAITGLGEDRITVSVEKLKELPAVEKEVVSEDSSGDKNYYKVKGALLSDLVSDLGESPDRINSVRLIAGDGYSIEVPEQIMKNKKIILAYEIDGELLYEKSRPVRAVIPGERSMYWVKNLVEIKVVDLVKTAEVNSLRFLETATAELKKVDYTYYDSTDKAVEISKLVDYMKLNKDFRTVNLRAFDGFEKKEKDDIFLNGYLKITGDNAPLFISPDIPKGMHVKNLLFIGYGSDVIFSLEEALALVETSSINDKMGIRLSKLVEMSDLSKVDKYKLEAIDGYSVEVSAADMEKGIVYFDEKGRIRSSFADLSKQYSIKHLYIIEGIK